MSDDIYSKEKKKRILGRKTLQIRERYRTMGLAASQARLLMLTARKDDVEGGLMALANQKLSMARKSADLSKDYSNALNMTKLMWSNGTGTDVNMTYPLLMNYNAGNTNGQYMLADNYNRAVLSGTYADMLCGSGKESIPKGGPLAITETEFLQKMGIKNAAECIKAYNADSNATASPVGGGVESYSDNDVWDNLAKGSAFQSVDKNGSKYNVLKPEYYNNSSKKDNAFVVRCSSQSTGEGTELDNFLNDVIGDIEQALGKSLASGSVDSEAFDAAVANTKEHYSRSLAESDVDKGDGGKSYKYESTAIDKTKGTNDIYQSFSGENTQFIDVNQLIKTFLNYYDAANAEINNTGEYTKYMQAVGEPSGSAAGVSTRKSDGRAAATTQTTTPPDGFEKASFYLTMYYYAQANGAVRSDAVDKDNGQYMQSLVKNGNVHLVQYVGSSTNNTKDWSIVSSGDQSSLVSEETDEDAVTKAKAKYDADKDELDYKESQIDMQITNLDTERSALDTEVDSVKAILNKNIERSFKLFQNA